jgi:phenylacetaldehyde dehydrogenase
MSTLAAATDGPDLLPQVQAFLDRRHRLLIGGEWVAGADGEPLEVEDPATGRTIATVTAAGPGDVDRAARAAARAFADGSAWRRTSAADRGLLIHRLADLIESHAAELAQLEALDSGKVVRVAREFDVELAIRHFQARR